MEPPQLFLLHHSKKKKNSTLKRRDKNTVKISLRDPRETKAISRFDLSVICHHPYQNSSYKKKDKKYCFIFWGNFTSLHYGQRYNEENIYTETKEHKNRQCKVQFLKNHCAYECNTISLYPYQTSCNQHLDILLLPNKHHSRPAQSSATDDWYWKRSRKSHQKS